MNNVYACLVHENSDAVRDLVRNLTYLDPESTVLLYNGGRDPGLLKAIEAAADGSRLLLHPDPRPLQWGTLHPFALDCMRFALSATDFETMTIVDSDQL